MHQRLALAALTTWLMLCGDPGVFTENFYVLLWLTTLLGGGFAGALQHVHVCLLLSPP